MNRLKLDFTLETANERSQFIENYIKQFVDENGTSTLTPDEMETIANYLLWGKDEKGIPVGAETQLKTKWTKEDEVDSLDEVLENPAFSKTRLLSLDEAVPLKKKRTVFSRTDARKNAPSYLLPVFEELWRSIDETDLLINFYEERTGKRTKPPREDLLKRFTSEEIDELKLRSNKLNQYQYLKQRHKLVELRREQFTLSDSYSSTLLTSGPLFQSNNVTLAFDCDVEVLPLGIKTGGLTDVIFEKQFNPATLTDEQLRAISKLVWTKRAAAPTKTFDFRNLEEVYWLFLYRIDLEEQIKRNKESGNLESNLSELLETLDFYEQIADLTEVQLEILHRKELHEKNSDIARIINKKYGKSYTANYISTIFKQKIVVKINEAAALHKDTVENCFFPENFKRCSDCGRILLLDERNWVKKSRSKDGFQNRCKRCERVNRQRKKGVKK